MKMIEAWLEELASAVMSCENARDRACVADVIADKLEEIGFKDRAEDVRNMSNEWLEQEGG